MATALNNLASLLQDQGELAAARPLYERALAIRERVLGAQMGTIGITATTVIGVRLGQVRPHVMFVDAPVSGSKGPAEPGQLLILASGPPTTDPIVRPAFSAIGRKTVWLGEAGKGSPMKLVGNAYMSTLIEGVAEALERVVVHGHSSGGLVSVLLADLAPERVERLVLASPALLGDPDPPLQMLPEPGQHGLAVPLLVEVAPGVQHVLRMARSAGVTARDLEEPLVLSGTNGSKLTLTWLDVGEQPPRPVRRSRYAQVVEQLQTRPGRWANLGERGAGTSSSLRKRGCKVAVRPNGIAGKAVVYASWPASG